MLQSSSSDIWTSNYTLKGQLETFDQFAIDGTYFQHETGLYHIYSCWFDALQSWPSNLCVNKLSDPWTTTNNLTDRAIISVPTQPWEKTPHGRTANIRLSSNEGPEQLVSPVTGQHFLIYSAARSDNPDYCLGQLALAHDGDPMNPGDWTKRDGCVFWQDRRAQAYGVGHASFVKSPDGSEDWVVYHGMQDPWSGWSARTIRAQRFGWAHDGAPSFPRPGYGPYEVPSGQM